MHFGVFTGKIRCDRDVFLYSIIYSTHVVTSQIKLHPEVFIVLQRFCLTTSSPLGASAKEMLRNTEKQNRNSCVYMISECVFFFFFLNRRLKMQRGSIATQSTEALYLKQRAAAFLSKASLSSEEVGYTLLRGSISLDLQSTEAKALNVEHDSHIRSLHMPQAVTHAHRHTTREQLL